MSRFLQASEALRNLVTNDRKTSSRRVAISSQSTGRLVGKIKRESEYRNIVAGGTGTYAYYFEYAHRVIYRINARFPVIIDIFDDNIDDTIAKNSTIILRPVRTETEVIEGGHFIFRPAGTFHAVYIKDSIFEKLQSLPEGQFAEAIDCEKDFDGDGEPSG